MTEPLQKLSDQAVVQILIVDFDTLACEETAAFDFCAKGCRAQSEKIKDSGKVIGLRVEGFDQMIRGKVIEVRKNEISISFVFASAEKIEKRKERRRKVSIPVWVTGRNSANGIRCEIVDASQSGCRLHGQHVDTLPDKIFLQIPGLDYPVPGQVAWRSLEHIGVKMQWKFLSGKELEKKRVKPPKPAAKVCEDTQQQKDRSGFGVRRKSS